MLIFFCDGNSEIYVMNFGGFNLKCFIKEWVIDLFLSWLFDGKKFVFVLLCWGDLYIFLMNVDGIGV